MTSITCARCGAPENKASAAYAEEGLVCGACHVDNKTIDAMQQKLQEQRGGRRRFFLRLHHDPTMLSAARLTEREVRGPLGARHQALEARGLTVQRIDISDTTKTPFGVKEVAGYRELWILPAPLAVDASFSPEGIGKKMTPTAPARTASRGWSRS